MIAPATTTQTTTALPWAISIAGQLAGIRAAVEPSPECRECKIQLRGLTELHELDALPDGMWEELEEILEFIREERPGPQDSVWPELLADVIRITNDWL